MILLKFLGSLFPVIEQTMDESVSPTENSKKSCRGASIFKESLKSSKNKIDEFFKNKTYEFKKKAKKFKKDEGEQLKSDKKRKTSKVADFLTPILSLRKFKDPTQKSYNKEGWSSKTKIGSCERLSSASLKKLNPYWQDSLANCDLTHLSKQQLDRQEAIYELYRSEVDLVEDLQMICKTYRDSMVKLNLIDDEEAVMLFSDVHLLIPIHKELVDSLAKVRLPDGRTEDVGHIILNWIPKLAVYILYCTSQVASKELFDSKMKSSTPGDFKFQDFLERCQACPFSRKMDLWTFLDVPRSRLVKYPLLLKSILKHTEMDHPDQLLLSESLEMVEEVIREVDFNAGRAKCQQFVNKLVFEDLRQMHPLIRESSLIVCEGTLRNRKGMKLHVFLLDKILILTRPYKSDPVTFRVYKRPIPVSNLFVVESSTKDGGKMGGEELYHQCGGGDDVDKNGVVGGGKLVVELERKDSGFSSPRTSLALRNVLSSLSRGRSSVGGGVSLSSISCDESHSIELLSYEGWNVGGGISNQSTCILKADNELDKQHWLQCLRRHVAGCLFPDTKSNLLERKCPTRRISAVCSNMLNGRIDGTCGSSVNARRYWVAAGSLGQGRVIATTPGNHLDGRTEMGDCSSSTISSYSSFNSVFSDSSFSTRQDLDVTGKENQDVSIRVCNFFASGMAKPNIHMEKSLHHLGSKGIFDDCFHGNYTGYLDEKWATSMLTLSETSRLSQL